MGNFFSGSSGKIAAAFIALAVVFSFPAFLWWLFSSNEQHSDIAEGVLRGSLVLALIGVVVAMQRRAEIRKREERENRPE